MPRPNAWGRADPRIQEPHLSQPSLVLRSVCFTALVSTGLRRRKRAGSCETSMRCSTRSRHELRATTTHRFCRTFFAGMHLNAPRSWSEPTLRVAPAHRPWRSLWRDSPPAEHRITAPYSVAVADRGRGAERVRRLASGFVFLSFSPVGLVSG